MKISEKTLSVCGIIGGVVLAAATVIVHTGEQMTNGNPDTGWLAMPSALCGISELLALIGAVGLLMGWMATHRAVCATCGKKMQAFSMLPAVGIVGIPLFHGNINCIEPLIYQVLSKHGIESIYSDFDAAISGSFAGVDLLILAAFYSQIIVMLYGLFSRRFGVSRWNALFNPVVFLVIGLMLSNILPASVSGLALGMRNIGEGLMYIVPLAYWSRKEKGIDNK